MISDCYMSLVSQVVSTLGKNVLVGVLLGVVSVGAAGGVVAEIVAPVHSKPSSLLGNTASNIKPASAQTVETSQDTSNQKQKIQTKTNDSAIQTKDQPEQPQDNPTKKTFSIKPFDLFQKDKPQVSPEIGTAEIDDKRPQRLKDKDQIDDRAEKLPKDNDSDAVVKKIPLPVDEIADGFVGIKDGNETTDTGESSESPISTETKTKTETN